MIKILNIFLFFIAYNIFANDVLFNEYKYLYNDLNNMDISGYKSSWDNINNKGSDAINFSQAALISTGINTNFGIVGDGFLKIKLDNDVIGYTRYGNFHIGLIDSDSVLTLRTIKYGYELYDQIIIPGITASLKLEGNILYAFLPDGKKIETGQVNVYEVDEDKLIRYKDGFFITKDNYNSQIKNDSIIVPNCVETSNVMVMETLMRMYFILWELKAHGYNYDNKIQIMLMLINNIPILNELSMIKMKLIDQWQRADLFNYFSGYNLLNNSLNLLRIE